MGTLGVAFFVFGAAMVATFFLYQRPHSVPLVPTGPIGHYFVAFTGCALIGWAGGLVGAARSPMASRSVATMTIFVLILMAVIRMAAWVIGDYSVWLGDLPRTEASAFLLDSTRSDLAEADGRREPQWERHGPTSRPPTRRSRSGLMILRALATVVVLGLFGLNAMLPTMSVVARGTENRVRADFESDLAIGRTLPTLELFDLDGRRFTREDLLGHRVLLTFERSVDW